MYYTFDDTCNDRIKLANERVTSLCDYILDTYVAADSNFSSNIWAEFSSLSTRRTNGCECFHLKFNVLFNTSRPNIHAFIEALKLVQCGTYIKMLTSAKKDKKSVGKDRFVGDNMLQVMSANYGKF